jgi:hypothetical protein
MPDRRPKEHFVPLCLRVSQTSAAREARTRPAGLHHPRSESFVFRTPSGARNPRASAAGARSRLRPAGRTPGQRQIASFEIVV